MVKKVICVKHAMKAQNAFLSLRKELQTMRVTTTKNFGAQKRISIVLQKH